MDKALIIFVKNLQKGKVKTRLAKTAGDEKAFAIYLYLLRSTYHIAAQANCDKYVFYADYIEENDPLCNPAFHKRLQKGEGLGERMSHAFSQMFKAGYQQVAIIGSDNMEITPLIIHHAFEQLHSSDLVIGPSKDGGYYLMAAQAFHAGLFENIPWSTSAVLHHTVRICGDENISYTLLPVLADIDTEEDWKLFLASSGVTIHL